MYLKDWFIKKRFRLASVPLLFMVIFSFQNCGQVNLMSQLSGSSLDVPEDPTPPDEAIPKAASDDGNYGPPPGYDNQPTPIIKGKPAACGADGCNFSILGGSSWVGARDSNTRPFNIELSDNQYVSFYFLTPETTTTDAHSGYLTTRVGTNTNNEEATIVYTLSKTRGQIQTDFGACTNFIHPAFINWSLGDNSRSDTCHLDPGTKYYINIAQRNSVDPTTSACLGKCGTQISKKIDQLVVNEGFRPKPACQYTEANPIFSHEMLIRPFGVQSFVINTDPGTYGAEKLFKNSATDGAFKQGGTFFTAIRPGNITSLKFTTPDITNPDIGDGRLQGVLANQEISNPAWSNIIAGPQTVSISECPGDFETSCTGSTSTPYAAGYNILNSDGRYLSDLAICVLKPNTDYYINYKTDMDLSASPEVDGVVRDNVFYGEGRLWIVH